MDDRDAEPFGLRCRPDAHGSAVDAELTGVGRVDTREQLHQRRLPRPVLPDETEDFAGIQVEVDVGEGAHSGE